MTTSFNYSLQNDTPNGKYSSTLIDEIRASGITVAISAVESVGDVLTIIFKADLSLAEELALNDLVASHQGSAVPDSPTVVRLHGPEDPDQKPIVCISPATIGLKTWLTGAGDGATADLRGLGGKFQIKFTGPGTEHADVTFNQPLELHDGQLNWGDAGVWSCDDRFTFSVITPATTVSDSPGSGDVTEVDLGGGLVAYAPAPNGDGSHTLTKKVPIPVKGTPLPGLWDCDVVTGIVTPRADSKGDFALVNFPQEAFFITNIGMGHRMGVFDVDVYRTDWIHNEWMIRLTVEKVTAGAGWVDGWILGYRPNNTRT